MVSMGMHVPAIAYFHCCVKDADARHKDAMLRLEAILPMQESLIRWSKKAVRSADFGSKE